MSKTKFRGAYDECEMTQSDVGNAMFLTQQTIQRIEQKAIESFRNELKNRGIDPRDLLKD